MLATASWAAQAAAAKRVHDRFVYITRLRHKLPVNCCWNLDIVLWWRLSQSHSNSFPGSQ